MNKIKVIQYTRMAVGLILFPLFVSIFILDRFCLLFFVWKNSVPIHKWLNEPKHISHSIFRILSTFALIGFIEFIKILI